MPKRIRVFKEVKLDILQAVKRAHRHRGTILGRRSPEPETQKPSPDKSRIKAKESLDTSQEAEKKLEEGPEKLLEAAEKAHEVLFRAETVFPFTLFPDHVTLDREKLTIAHRSFIKVAKIVTVPVQDILSVEVDIGPFFGSVHTASRYFVTSPHTVSFLWRADAITLQRLLQGYIIATEQNIDCSAVDIDQLKILLKDLGQGAPD